jgi:hypothetical protein
MSASLAEARCARAFLACLCGTLRVGVGSLEALWSFVAFGEIQECLSPVSVSSSPSKVIDLARLAEAMTAEEMHLSSRLGACKI